MVLLARPKTRYEGVAITRYRLDGSLIKESPAHRPADRISEVL